MSYVWLIFQINLSFLKTKYRVNPYKFAIKPKKFVKNIGLTLKFMV